MPEDPAAPKPPTVAKSWGGAVFKAGAISNWIVALPAIIDPGGAAEMLGLDGMHYFYLMRIWAGMAFLWGVMFWEISRSLDAHKPMIKYAWLEKCVTTVCVALGYAYGRVEGPLLGLMILYTDVFWIVLFLYYDWRTRGNPLPASALADARRTLGLER
jgi:hypothetical protein